MKKIKLDPYNTDTPSSYPTPKMKQLFEAILSLKTEEEAADFFRDLLTMAELKEFANRWQMVKMIANRIPYHDIAEELGVSTTTVARVAHWYNNGFKGYETALSRTTKVPKPRSEFVENAERNLKSMMKLRK